jgi:predicted nucleic acid-binding protein
VLSLGDDVVRRWGRNSGEVKRASGHAPPVIDRLLAACAIEHDLYLVTRNVRDAKPPEQACSTRGMTTQRISH